jgi:hypothetical protein
MRHIKQHILAAALILGGISTAGCDLDGDEFRAGDREDYICYVSEWNEDGTVRSLECPDIDGEPRTAGGSCYGELMCCDKVTLGCFCADTEHGAVCPSGSVAAGAWPPTVPKRTSSGNVHGKPRGPTRGALAV